MTFGVIEQHRVCNSVLKESRGHVTAVSLTHVHSSAAVLVVEYSFLLFFHVKGVAPATISEYEKMF